MEKKHRERLRSNTVKLGEDLDMPLLFNHLIESRLLNSDDVEILQVSQSILINTQFLNRQIVYRLF